MPAGAPFKRGGGADSSCPAPSPFSQRTAQSTAGGDCRWTVLFSPAGPAAAKERQRVKSREEDPPGGWTADGNWEGNGEVAKPEVATCWMVRPDYMEFNGDLLEENMERSLLKFCQPQKKEGKANEELKGH
ncbi:hypothetical protein E2320_014505 [Naja naja]|nr:hypothetical protein E2320_014505 [Naja naja]